MEIIFGLLVLALLIVGLRNRNKKKNEWLKEERYEESGDWIDKRSGERGSYGSLDEEMEANRSYISKQGKISELAQAVQTFCFAQISDFQKLSDSQLKKHHAFCKSEISGLFEHIEQLISGRAINISGTLFQQDDISAALKKLVMGLSFEHFPKLLDVEIEGIKKFDLLTAQFAKRVLVEIDHLKG